MTGNQWSSEVPVRVPTLILGLAAIPTGLGCNRNADVDTDPGDMFGDTDTVRITAPEEGATVEDTFSLEFTAGSEVEWVQVEADAEPASAYVAASDGEIELTLDDGRHTLVLAGFDGARSELTRDILHVRVLPDQTTEGWVTIASPVDGSHPIDPVQVVVDASSTIDTIEVWASGYHLGDVPPDGVFTADFVTTGTERVLEVRGLAGGQQISSDSIEITPESPEPVAASDFNQLVLDLIETYPDDGTYSYYWPSSGNWSGSTRDLWYQDTLIADDGGYSSCYCSGITWELFVRAWQEWDRAHGGDGDDLNGLSASEVLDMRRDWYVRELDGPGPSIAMELTGTGHTVESFADWRPGDFVQIWRTSGSGHSVVFMGWLTDTDGNILGMDYVSCQGSTDGFGRNDEYFGPFSGALDPLKLYAGRGLMPGDHY